LFGQNHEVAADGNRRRIEVSGQLFDGAVTYLV
jgi:hypothetical protein